MPQRTIEGIEELTQLAGQEIGLSDWIEVPQATIDSFAATTGDRQWIHVDRERAARNSPFGTTIAHGFLTLSLLSRLKSQAVAVTGVTMAINYGLNRVRFPSPVRSGARIRGRFILQSVGPIEGGVQTVLAATVEVEGQQKPALAAEWVLRFYR
jgi:acyl dehydratase